MQLKEQNVLMFEKSMNLGGSSKIVIEICKALKPEVNKIVVCSIGGENVNELTRLGIVHYCIPDISNIKNCLKIVVELKNIISKEKITIIHTHHRMAALYVEILRAYKKCFFLHTSHGRFYDHFIFTRLGLKHAKIIACGDNVALNLINIYKIPKERIRIISNAVDEYYGSTQKDDFIKQLKEKGYFIIANFGRLSKEKGFDNYIKCIPEVLGRHRNTIFLIFGYGPEQENLKQLSIDESVENNLFFMGYRDNIQNIMSQIDLVVLSSHTEGLPLTPIEAFSVGRTVVATNVCGTNEIIADESNGILVADNDPEALAEGICSIIDSDKLKKKLERNALNTYKSHYTMKKFNMSYIKAYADLVNGSWI